MLYLGTQSTVEPARVIVEEMPDGERVVRLADNIRVVEDGAQEGETSTHFEYDEVVFTMPEDREDTEAEIEEEFEAWWLFGIEDEDEDTLEQRVADLEDIVFSLIIGGDE